MPSLVASNPEFKCCEIRATAGRGNRSQVLKAQAELKVSCFPGRAELQFQVCQWEAEADILCQIPPGRARSISVSQSLQRGIPENVLTYQSAANGAVD